MPGTVMQRGNQSEEKALEQALVRMKDMVAKAESDKIEDVSEHRGGASFRGYSLTVDRHTLVIGVEHNRSVSSLLRYSATLSKLIGSKNEAQELARVSGYGGPIIPADESVKEGLFLESLFDDLHQIATTGSFDRNGSLRRLAQSMVSRNHGPSAAVVERDWQEYMTALGH